MYKSTRIFLGIFFLVLIDVFFISCNSDEKNQEILISNNINRFSEFPVVQSIKFNEILDYIYGTPNELYLKDSLLVILNSNKNCKYFFYICDLTQNKISEMHILEKGKGPREALGIACGGIQDSTLWAYDITKNTLFMLNIEESVKIKDIYDFQSFKFESRDFSRMRLFKHGNIIGTGERDSKFVVCNLDTSISIFDYGDFAQLPKKIPKEATLDALTANIFVNSIKDKVALAYRYTDVVEIFNLNDEMPGKTMQGCDFIDLDFKVGKSLGHIWMEKTKKTRKAFVNGYTTNKYIYLIYSGNSYEDENWSYGKELYVYNWEGVPVKCIKLDRYIYCICVSDDDRLFYSYDINTGKLIRGIL